MTRRRALTLIEVLVTLFIMSIGMLALLVLFPLGALSMAQALKDDRCATTASMAENVAIAMNVRYDPKVQAAFGFVPANNPPVVYVDPYYVIEYPMTPPPTPPNPLPPFLSQNPLGGWIPRVAPSFVATLQQADRWFSLPDDIGFGGSATPNLVNAGGIVERGRRYSYAYLLRQEGGVGNLINLAVVVYAARPVGSLAPEFTYTTPQVSGSMGTNSIILNATGTSLRTGRWILDSGNGIFYRVTNLTEIGGSTVVEVQPNLIANVNQVTLMDDVVEVFDKGTGWQQ